MNNCIEIRDLYKELQGTTVLENINIKMESGKIYGFIGRNGSGKTMLFRTIAGLIYPSSGKIICNNTEVALNDRIPLTIGLMIENAGLYSDLSSIDNLVFLASIKKRVSIEKIKKVIEDVGLDSNDKRKIKKYSLGMKQRLVFAQAVMEEPELLLLDEPTNGLDENGINLIRSIILQEKKRGAIICIASHNSEDIKVLCDEIFEMCEGKLCNKECEEV